MDIRNDPVASKRPDMPFTGTGKNGKVGTSVTAHMMKQLIKDTTRDEDPREAILKHAQAAEGTLIRFVYCKETDQLNRGSLLGCTCL